MMIYPTIPMRACIGISTVAADRACTFFCFFSVLGLQNERYDRGLLQGDSGTHSVTDSYDLNSYGSYASDASDGDHEVGPFQTTVADNK